MRWDNHWIYTLDEAAFGIIFIICRCFVGVYWGCKNYTCLESPLMLDLVCSAFIVLSSFWVVSIFSTVGMKFASKGRSTKFIRGYLWTINKIKKSILLRILIHGGFAIGCMVIPAISKMKELSRLQS